MWNRLKGWQKGAVLGALCGLSMLIRLYIFMVPVVALYIVANLWSPSLLAALNADSLKYFLPINIAFYALLGTWFGWILDRKGKKAMRTALWTATIITGIVLLAFAFYNYYNA